MSVGDDGAFGCADEVVMLAAAGWCSPPSARVMVVMRPRSSVIWTRSPGRKGPRRLIAPVGVGVPLLRRVILLGLGQSVLFAVAAGWTEKVLFYFARSLQIGCGALPRKRDNAGHGWSNDR